MFNLIFLILVINFCCFQPTLNSCTLHSSNAIFIVFNTEDDDELTTATTKPNKKASALSTSIRVLHKRRKLPEWGLRKYSKVIPSLFHRKCFHSVSTDLATIWPAMMNQHSQTCCTGVDDIYEIIFVSETVSCPNDSVALANGPCLESTSSPAIFYAPNPNDLGSMNQAKLFASQARTIDQDDLYNSDSAMTHFNTRVGTSPSLSTQHGQPGGPLSQWWNLVNTELNTVSCQVLMNGSLIWKAVIIKM